MPAKRKRLPADAPAGTFVLVVEDDKSVTRTSTRSVPWKLASGHVVVMLSDRRGCFLAQRCHLDGGAA
jgi:hypothetical protein